MAGGFARVLYALALVSVLGLSAWLSFSRYVAGSSHQVPDLTGKTVEEAQMMAAGRGLRLVVDRSQEAFDDRVPQHRIRGQNPPPDMAVKAGQDLHVSISLGPRIVRAPDLTGMTARTAALTLVRGGLLEGAVASTRLAAPAGVVAQGVSPGVTAAPESRVDLLVNRGAPDLVYIMPDLIGRDLERVRAGFEARGFRLGGVRSQPYEGAAAGTILRQFPLAGSPLTRHDSISFVVASAEGPST
jgi:eukaryotic-like serine/threonine-protein kinase